MKIQRLTLFAILLTFISCKNNTVFQPVSSGHSGIHFNNQIVENDSINPIDLINVYNGGGVGIGDFNNDGLPDIYFTGNTVSNKLYLNRGNFVFEDVTDAAGVGGNGEWCRGASIVDVNNDGLPDIYVCANIKTDARQRTNLLYINQGTDSKGIPHFKEMGAEYGLADTLYSTMATFFDYDNDGDLDMYLVVNNIPHGYNSINSFRKIVTDGSFFSTGHLYRNEWSDSLKHPVFRDVSKEAGITIEGFGHAATIADINQDGWKDIYVTNDFIGDNILYINNHDGTFTDKAKSYFKHTSATAMGQDIVDMNNDGLADVVELDMNPPDNYRKKMFLGVSSYLTYQNSDRYGFQYQYVRNSFQLNRGPRVNGFDSIGDPIFSEISFLSGIAETDWSWTPVVADFNNDGWRDLIVTGGYPKDITDHDFQMFMRQASNLISHQSVMSQIPQVKIHNFAFRNNGDLTFSDVSADWGMLTPGFSNGAAYADLDGDGDLDLVINNINDEAHIYRNMTREQHPADDHYLRVKLLGDSLNKGGFGAWVELHYDSGRRQQVYEVNPYRGYLSTDENIVHFGVGKTTMVDSLVVRWPNGRMQLIQHVACDQVVKVDYREARLPWSFEPNLLASDARFRNITDSVGIHYKQEERDYIDFNIQKMIPHKFSQYGPGIAVGDIDGNGLDDMVVGGSAGYSAQLFLQQRDGQFLQVALVADSLAMRKAGDDLGVLLFDADGDGDLDLYIASGGYENEAGSTAYGDRIYVNDGKGHFTLAADALPQNFTSKFCVRAADFDHDGRLDLFISGRVDPRHYPKPVSSFIYRNDTRDGHLRFVDVTADVAPGLERIGMVCDGIWSDVDNDGWPDLVVAGEWMPLTVFHNDKGILKDISSGTGVSGEKGWWNSIVAGDFDNDGDIDYVVGNLGLNSYYRAGHDQPVRVYGGDFDSNGVYDVIPSLYLPDLKGEKKEFPAMGRDDLLRQITVMRKRFPTYKSFATATMDQVLTPEQRRGATILAANQMRSCLFRNDGGGKFTMIPLPVEAQFSMLNGMVAEDFDGDGNLDLVINGNDYSTEVATGRYDALNGLFLKGDGTGRFSSETILQSGIFIPGDGKALVRLRGAGGHQLLAAGQNRGRLEVFEQRQASRMIPLAPTDRTAEVRLKNGKVRREEFYYGESFLSQSGRFLEWTCPTLSVEVTDGAGKKRIIK